MESEVYCQNNNSSTFYGHFMTNECDVTTMTFKRQRNSSFSTKEGCRLHFLPTEFLFFKYLCPSFLSSSRHRPSSIFVTSSLTSKMIFVLFCVFLASQSFVPTTGEYYFCNLNKRGGERLCSPTSIDLRLQYIVHNFTASVLLVPCSLLFLMFFTFVPSLCRMVFVLETYFVITREGKRTVFIRFSLQMQRS